MDGTPFGRYQLIEKVGEGGMGEVWRAHDSQMNRIVALKVLPAHFASDRTFQERFRREAQCAAGLDEPHVVPIYDFGETDGRLYIAMRLIAGQDLLSLLKSGPLKPRRAVKIIEQIASALQAAHEIGLVHRDIKPSNILVAQDDFAYLIDFGIARTAEQTGLTSTGIAIGTWAYMSPERLNTGTADASADIYALTCVLHEALTGQRPFPGDSLEQQIVGHLTTPPPRPSTMDASVPQSMDEVIAIGMAKNPEDRYSTARELVKSARSALRKPADFGHARRRDLQTESPHSDAAAPTEPAPLDPAPAQGPRISLTTAQWLILGAVVLLLLLLLLRWLGASSHGELTASLEHVRTQRTTIARRQTTTTALTTQLLQIQTSSPTTTTEEAASTRTNSDAQFLADWHGQGHKTLVGDDAEVQGAHYVCIAMEDQRGAPVAWVRQQFNLGQDAAVAFINTAATHYCPEWRLGD